MSKITALVAVALFCVLGFFLREPLGKVTPSDSQPLFGIRLLPPNLPSLARSFIGSVGGQTSAPSASEVEALKDEALAAATVGDALDAAAFVERLRRFDSKALLGIGEALFAEPGTSPRKRALEQTLASVLAVADPEEAADLFSRDDLDGYNHMPFQIVITAWTEADSDAARDWFVSNYGNGDSDIAELFLQSLIQNDLESALELAEDLPWKRQKRIMKKLKREDLDGALAFLGAIEQTQSVRRLKGALGRRYARMGKRAKAQLVMEGLDSTEPEWQENALELVVPVISTWDPTESFRSRVDWLMARSTAEAKPDQVSMITRHWVREDPTAVSEWLATMAPGEARDQGYAHFARMRRKTDARGAFEWAAGIGNVDLRGEMARLVYDDWVLIDAPAAEERWLAFQSS